MKKVGFAFLLYEKLHNQLILKQFFDKLKNQHGCDIHAVAHTKNNAKFDCVFDIDFIDSIETSWCDPSCVKASIMLFEKLFEQGCEVVYLMSDGMIPLDNCAEFIAKNNTTTFKLQTNDFEKLNTEQIAHRICNWAWTSDEVRRMLPYNRFDKQVMFFCITSYDFEKCRGWFDQIRPSHKENLQYSVMDEYFWVNAMKLSGLSYQNNYKYIYMNSDQSKTQSETFKKIPDDVYKNFMFLRKIYLDDKS